MPDKVEKTARSLPVSLQCSKCGQIMQFNVQEGKDAIAVCDRCNIPMTKLAEVVKSDREMDIEEQFVALSIQVSALSDSFNDLRMDIGLDYDKEHASPAEQRRHKRSLAGRLKAVEEKLDKEIELLEEYKANKWFKRRPKKSDE
jgi:hypothetical protein